MELDLKKKFIKRCIELAKKGAGHVSPNPLVGAILVLDNQIIGEGYYEIYGGPHAEINAIESVPSNLKNKIGQSSLFISLEPCNIYAKTPPCTDAILHHGIKQVFISTHDPNPQMNGKSVALLREKGIEVELGILQEEGNHLIRFFSTYHIKKRPYITIKMAVSKDGFIGNGRENIWISDPINKVISHTMRAEHDAIMIGTNTAVIDNPHLTTREFPGSNPVRIVLDRNFRIKSSSNVYDNQAETITFSTCYHSDSETNKYIQLNSDDFSLENIIQKLYEMGMQSILIEGGQKLIKSFVSQNLWDETFIFESRNFNLHSGLIAPGLERAEYDSYISGNDIIKHYKNI